jgi:hypothetical protein
MKVGSQLSDLYTMRIHADYRLAREDVENQKTAQGLVEQANRMIKILDGNCSGTRRTHIIEAIQQWEKKVIGGGS